MEIMPALGQALWLPPNLKSEFQGYNVKMPRHSRDQGKNARPRAPPAAFGLPRPAVYGSPQAAWGARGRAFLPGARERHVIFTLSTWNSDFQRYKIIKISHWACIMATSKCWIKCVSCVVDYALVSQKNFLVKFGASHNACPRAVVISNNACPVQ